MDCGVVGAVSECIDTNRDWRAMFSFVYVYSSAAESEYLLNVAENGMKSSSKDVKKIDDRCSKGCRNSSALCFERIERVRRTSGKNHAQAHTTACSY